MGPRELQQPLPGERPDRGAGIVVVPALFRHGGPLPTGVDE
ncbi:MAG: hypothetical protein R3D28_06560 [Geminicoccaceae bacterium]